MGQSVGHLFAPHVFRGYPDSHLESKYDPMFGFPRGRKPRVSYATALEMDSAKIETRFRDYCAHKLLKVRACKARNTPFIGRCHHYIHSWEECQYQDQVLRMKEYERERRLDLRQKRILKKLQEEQGSEE